MSDLPKPGEVWGVPDKPETWRWVDAMLGDYVYYFTFSGYGTEHRLMRQWPTSYVRIFPKDTP